MSEFSNRIFLTNANIFTKTEYMTFDLQNEVEGQIKIEDIANIKELLFFSILRHILTNLLKRL